MGMFFLQLYVREKQILKQKKAFIKFSNLLSVSLLMLSTVATHFLRRFFNLKSHQTRLFLLTSLHSEMKLVRRLTWVTFFDARFSFDPAIALLYSYPQGPFA